MARNLDWAARPFGIFLDPRLRRSGRWIVYSAMIGGVSGVGAIAFDLLFRLEEALGEKVPVEHWEEFLRRRLAGGDAATGITLELVVAFVEEQRQGA